MELTLAILVLGLLGMILFAYGLRRIWRWKMLSGSLQGISGALLLALALLLASIAANLRTYQRLSHEIPVASLRFEQLGPQYFRVIVNRAERQNAEVYDLHGDEWQLDARVLKWRALAGFFGMDTGYQLERLSGRYRELQQAQQSQHSVYGLYQAQGIDIWQLARRHPHWLPWVDAVYGSATYMPMAQGASYQISISQSGLLARPTNEAARHAIQNWR